MADRIPETRNHKTSQIIATSNAKIGVVEKTIYRPSCFQVRAPRTSGFLRFRQVLRFFGWRAANLANFARFFPFCMSAIVGLVLNERLRTSKAALGRLVGCFDFVDLVAGAGFEPATF
ncbi:hypothetical protein, partial [Ruegeria arenilitoris]|uniref:hypothetical protein n=1 Tax=Ruegeria arenilitoris TaxID=1173585 RepID=UPI001C2BDD62